MLTEEAARIVAYLNAAFPRDALEGESLAILTSEIALLADRELAFEAAHRHAQNDVRFPSISAFRRTYRSVADQRAAASRAASIPEETGETPSPIGPEGWERLAQAHRELRARDFRETPDPAAGKPLPRNRAQFSAEWSDFLRVRFSGAVVEAM